MKPRYNVDISGDLWQLGDTLFFFLTYVVVDVDTVVVDIDLDEYMNVEVDEVVDEDVNVNIDVL